MQTISCETCGSSSSAFKEVNPFDFIADALHIWQVGMRAERWPLICCWHVPAALVLHMIWVEIRQRPHVLWKVLTMTAHAL